MIKVFSSMLNSFFMKLGPGSKPDPNIYYRTTFFETIGAEKPHPFFGCGFHEKPYLASLSIMSTVTCDSGQAVRL